MFCNIRELGRITSCSMVALTLVASEVRAQCSTRISSGTSSSVASVAFNNLVATTTYRLDYDVLWGTLSGRYLNFAMNAGWPPGAHSYQYIGERMYVFSASWRHTT